MRILLAILAFSASLWAQGWSGLDASRKSSYWHNTGHIDTTTGNYNGIPSSSYTVACATVSPYSPPDQTGAHDTAAIQAAISGCPAGQFVQLTAGVFYVNYLTVHQNSLVLRGAGPSSTFIDYTNGSGTTTGCGLSSNFCVYATAVSFINTNVYQGKGANQANWTAGYTQGTTTITLDKVTGLAAGDILVLNQNNNQVGITSITGNGATATVTTFKPHGFTTGDSIGIGCDVGTTGYNNYNGWQTITVVDAYTFTFASTNTATCQANTGSATWSASTTYALSNLVQYNGIGYKSYKSSNLNNQPDVNLTCAGNPCTPYWAVVQAGNALKETFGNAEPLLYETTDYVGRIGYNQTLSIQNYDGTDRSIEQRVYVQSVDSAGKTVTFTPPLYLQGINASQNPGVRWFVPVHDVGIEDLTFDYGSTCNARGTSANPPRTGGSLCSTATQGLTFSGCFNCWTKNVHFIDGYEQIVAMTNDSANTEIRDGYFFLTWTANEAYSIETYYASNYRIENNIFHHVAAPITVGLSSGGYFGYNYCNDMFWVQSSGSSAYQGGNYMHDPSINTLLEGNTCAVDIADIYWGSPLFLTLLRNWNYGPDQLGPNPPAGVTKSKNTALVNAESYARYLNSIGNVLGPTDNTGGGTYPGGYYQNYKVIANNIGTMCSGATLAQATSAIYLFGFGGSDNTGMLNTYGTNYCDTNVSPTAFIWGNYDVVSNAARWCGNSSNTGWGTTCSSTSEVPTGLSKYANAVPATETVGKSFVYGTDPTWFKSSYGTVTWPPIGPDVTGNTGPGNKVAKLPAQLCFENSPTTSTTQGNVLSFDTNSCYGTYVPTPSCTLSASPSVTQYGDAVTLTYTSSNATSGTIDNGIGNAPNISSGSTSGAATSLGSVTYTLTVIGADSRASCSALAITVNKKTADIAY